MSLGNLAEQWAQQRPKGIALIDGDREITFADLDKSVNRVANGLRALGIRADDRVAIMLPNTPEFVYTFYGCQKLGAVAVPFNTMYKGGEILHILRDSGAGVIVCLTNFVPLINEIRSDLPHLKHVITTGERTVTFADPQSTAFMQAVLGKSGFSDLDDAYRKIGEAVLAGFHGLGVTKAWYRHRGSVRVGGRKLAGFLISEIEDIYLINVVGFLAAFDPSDFFAAIWVPPEVKDKIVEPLASVAEELGRQVTIEEFRQAMVAGIEKNFGVSLSEGSLTREEKFGYQKQRALSSKGVGKAAIPAGSFLGRIKRLFRFSK